MVQLAIEKAKDMGLPIFVSSEPQARSLFVKAGFKETSFFDIDLSPRAPEHCGFGVFRLSGLIMES